MSNQEFKLPFYMRIDQPWRGILLVIMSILIGLAFYYVGTASFMWTAAEAPISYLLLGMPGLIIFAAMFLFQMYGFNWFFFKFKQPAQFIVGSLFTILFGAVVYLIMAKVVKFEAVDIGIIGIAWLFWILALGGWTGMPIAEAFRFKQPITIITGFIVTFGLALISWWLIPATFHGVNTGLPFLWFLVTAIFGFAWSNWPMQVNKNFIIVLMGYVGMFTFIFIWLMRLAGLDYFAPFGSPEYNRGGAFLNWYMMMLFFQIVCFQFWPFHKLPNFWKGLCVNILGLVLGIVAYLVITNMGAAAGDYIWMWYGKVTSFGLSLFVGIFLFFTMGGMAMAPPPKGTFVEPPKE